MNIAQRLPTLSRQAQKPSSDSALEDSYQLVSDRRRIRHILNELQREKALLTALVDGNENAFTTAILELDEKGDAMVVDELVPAPGENVIVPGSGLWLLGQVQGIKTAFKSSVLEVGEEDRLPFYRVAFPATIRHQQRRKSYRAPVALSIRSEVRLQREDGLSLAGQLRDLSVGGLSVMLKVLREIEALSPGLTFTECDLELPGEGHVSVQAEIRHLHTDPIRKTLYLGLAFQELPPQDQRLIQRSVSHLERELLRKKQLKKET